MRFAVEFRSHWRAWLVVALLAGLAGGILVAVAAGARRTDSALARHLTVYGFRNARVVGVSGASPSVLEHLKKLPMVAAGSIGDEFVFEARDARGRPISGQEGHGMTLYGSTDGNDGVTVDRWKFLSGRRPNEGRPSEVVLDSRAARTFGVQAGGWIRLSVGDPVRLKVVGVVASTDPVAWPEGVVRLTPAFYQAHRPPALDYVLDVRLRRGAAGFPAFRRAVVKWTGEAFVNDQSQRSSEIQGSIHELAQALWLGVWAGALLAFLLVAQSLSRLSAAASGQYPTLRAVGMTSRQLIALGIARAATVALAAAVLAVGVALALSPLAPVGYARELEPTPGFDVDPLVVGLGGAAVLAAVLMAGSLGAWRAADRVRTRPADRVGRVRAADALARWGLAAPLVTGVRLALARRRGPNAFSAGSALAGVTLAVAVIAAALTFSASLHHLFSTPRLFGQNWDYRVDNPDMTAFKNEVHDPRLSVLALGDDKGIVQVNGRSVGAWAMEPPKKSRGRGTLQPTIIAGRAPKRDNEIALGTKTMRALGVHIGEKVHIAGPGGPEPMQLVGRVVLPSNWQNPLGEGAVVTWGAFDRVAALGGDVMFARIAPEANRARTLTRLEHLFGAPAPGLPAPVANFGGVNALPAAISAVLVAISLGALTQTLVVAVRGRRRDLAILKTLGFDRRQVLAAVVWQATTLAAIGLLIGLPLGDALGRWLWNLFADQLGVVPEAVTSPLLLLIVPGAIVLANLVAVFPARMAAKTRPALVLRAE